jgi:hypothetical protein
MQTHSSSLISRTPQNLSACSSACRLTWAIEVEPQTEHRILAFGMVSCHWLQQLGTSGDRRIFAFEQALRVDRPHSDLSFATQAPCLPLKGSVRRTDEGGRCPHGDAPNRRVFDAQGISPTKAGQIHEGVALLLLIAAAGGDGAEKSIAGASGGLPAARCTSCNPQRRQGQGVPPAEWPQWAREQLARQAIEGARGAVPRTMPPQALSSRKPLQEQPIDAPETMSQGHEAPNPPIRPRLEASLGQRVGPVAPTD